MFIYSDWFSKPVGQYTKFVEKCVEEFTMKENQNRAPKILEGGYYLTIHDNEITLYSDRDGMATTAKCHPDDKFNLKYGLDVVFGQMIAKKEKKDKEIKVGDEVKVVDNTKTYIMYLSWLCDHCDFGIVKCYAYKEVPREGTTGRVVAVGEHGKIDRTLVAFYTNNGRVFLVEDKGLKKVVN